jgi:hypothetical protein
VRCARALAVACALAACGSAGTSAPPRRSGLERAIGDALARRFGFAVATRCSVWPPACRAILPDRTVVPIALARGSAGEVEWRVVGMLVMTDSIEQYLRGELADLGAPQNAICAPQIRRVEPGEQIQCSLQRGGAAFVTVRADGTFALELELDPAAAAARGAVVTPEADRDLMTRSRALEGGDDDDSDDPR